MRTPGDSRSLPAALDELSGLAEEGDRAHLHREAASLVPQQIGRPRGRLDEANAGITGAGGPGPDGHGASHPALER